MKKKQLLQRIEALETLAKIHEKRFEIIERFMFETDERLKKLELNGSHISHGGLDAAKKQGELDRIETNNWREGEDLMYGQKSHAVKEAPNYDPDRSILWNYWNSK